MVGRSYESSAGRALDRNCCARDVTVRSHECSPVRLPPSYPFDPLRIGWKSGEGGNCQRLDHSVISWPHHSAIPRQPYPLIHPRLRPSPLCLNLNVRATTECHHDSAFAGSYRASVGLRHGFGSFAKLRRYVRNLVHVYCGSRSSRTAVNAHAVGT